MKSKYILALLMLSSLLPASPVFASGNPGFCGTKMTESECRAWVSTMFAAYSTSRPSEESSDSSKSNKELFMAAKPHAYEYVTQDNIQPDPILKDAMNVLQESYPQASFKELAIKILMMDLDI